MALPPTSSSFSLQSHLYLLVTDQGFLQEEQVVWESLHTVDGDSCFCDSDFHLNHYLGRGPGAGGGGGSPEKQRQVDQVCGLFGKGRGELVCSRALCWRRVRCDSSCRCHDPRYPCPLTVTSRPPPSPQMMYLAVGLALEGELVNVKEKQDGFGNLKPG